MREAEQRVEVGRVADWLRQGGERLVDFAIGDPAGFMAEYEVRFPFAADGALDRAWQIIVDEKAAAVLMSERLRRFTPMGRPN